MLLVGVLPRRILFAQILMQLHQIMIVCLLSPVLPVASVQVLIVPLPSATLTEETAAATHAAEKGDTTTTRAAAFLTVVRHRAQLDPKL